MSDITIEIGTVCINIRVGGLIRNNGKILLCQIPGTTYWFLPGGRIKTNESSYEALARELLEELGSGFKINSPQISSENYFSSDNKNYHEIAFYYSVSWDGSPIVSKGKESFIWINENKIHDYDIRPSFIKDYVSNGKTEMIHIIQKDM
jgi:8-oxo-dGTP pyrophosphatase MutT (NUDIX family)